MPPERPAAGSPVVVVLRCVPCGAAIVCAGGELGSAAADVAASAVAAVCRFEKWPGGNFGVICRGLGRGSAGLRCVVRLRGPGATCVAVRGGAFGGDSEGGAAATAVGGCGASEVPFGAGAAGGGLCGRRCAVHWVLGCCVGSVDVGGYDGC